MLDEKQKKECATIVKQLISEGKIIKPLPIARQFFMDKALNSLQTSKRLFEISEDENDSLEAYMWVVNTAYYSMFYAATSLLARFNKKINVEVGIHQLTYCSLAYYFIVDDNKFQKHFIEQYKESYNNAEQLLQISDERSIEIAENFGFEKSKRKTFTYDVGAIAERNKAKTSLDRAQAFLNEVRKIIEKVK